MSKTFRKKKTQKAKHFRDTKPYMTNILRNTKHERAKCLVEQNPAKPIY